MNDRKIIESYKTVRAIEQAQPKPLSATDIEYIKSVIVDGLAKALKDSKPETRSYEQIVSDIESSNDAPSLKQLKLSIAGIADRVTHRSTRLSSSSEEATTQASDEPLPLHERIKFLQKS